MKGRAVASGKEGGAPGRGLSTEVSRLTGCLKPPPCIWPDLGDSQSSFRLPLPADPQKPLCGWKDVLIFQMWKLRPSWGSRYPLDVQTARAKARCNCKLCTAWLPRARATWESGWRLSLHGLECLLHGLESRRISTWGAWAATLRRQPC